MVRSWPPLLISIYVFISKLTLVLSHITHYGFVTFVQTVSYINSKNVYSSINFETEVYTALSLTVNVASVNQFLKAANVESL